MFHTAINESKETDAVMNPGSFISNSSLPVNVYTTEGQLVYSNKASVTLFGLAEANADLTHLHIEETEKLLKQMANGPLERNGRYSFHNNGKIMVTHERLELIQEGEAQYICSFILHHSVSQKGKKASIPLARPVGENRPDGVLEEIMTENIPGFILLRINKDLTCTDARGKGLEIFGYTSLSLKGKAVGKTRLAGDDTVLPQAIQKALKGEKTVVEAEYNEEHFYQWVLSPLPDGSSQVHEVIAIGINMDDICRTKKIKNEAIKELQQKNHQLKIENGVRQLIQKNLQEQTKELEQKNQELEQFAYVASHDLQEPLRMVSSYTQLLANRYKDTLDASAEEFVTYAVEGASRMQHLINDLLSYSRVGRKEMSFEKINLDIVLQIVQRNLLLLIEETGAQLKFEKMPFIEGDASQLVQLFQNLISNAIKFRKDGFKPEISITAEKEGKLLVVKVKDNGIGMNMQYKDRIFQIFQRLHTRDKYPGTGIGLAICKKIVERHGGSIWIESELGLGTTFFITFPLSQ